MAIEEQPNGNGPANSAPEDGPIDLPSTPPLNSVNSPLDDVGVSCYNSDWDADDDMYTSFLYEPSDTHLCTNYEELRCLFPNDSLNQFLARAPESYCHACRVENARLGIRWVAPTLYV